MRQPKAHVARSTDRIADLLHFSGLNPSDFVRAGLRVRRALFFPAPETRFCAGLFAPVRLLIACSASLGFLIR